MSLSLLWAPIFGTLILPSIPTPERHLGPGCPSCTPKPAGPQNPASLTRLPLQPCKGTHVLLRTLGHLGSMQGPC